MDQARAGDAIRLGLEGFPVGWQQLLGEVGGFPFEIEDVVGIIFRVVVGPAVTPVYVEVDETTINFGFGRNTFAWLDHDLVWADDLVDNLALRQSVTVTEFEDTCIRECTVLICAIDASTDVVGVMGALDQGDAWFAAQW